MKEGSDFRHEQNLPLRLNRREFLKLAAATVGGVMLQTACGPLEQVSAQLKCSLNRRLEIPSSYINDLEEAIAPLARLMPHATAENLTIKVAKKTDGTGGSCALDTKNEIRILLPDASPEHMGFGKVIAFHEAAHIFDQGDNTPSDYLKEQMKKRMGRNKYISNELEILKESSYCNISTCKNTGHPESNYKEVFASSITILRFYPFEFIEKLEGFSNPESKRFLATNGLVCIDALKKFSAIPVEYSDLPFDPNLVAYLMQEGQTSVS